MKLYAQPIFTLNARDNFALELTRDYLKLDSKVMHREIQQLHIETQRVLTGKGLSYSDLKSALVPTVDRNEAGFIFDSRAIESFSYGAEVARLFLRLFDKRTTQSILCGDLLGNNQDLIFRILGDHMVLARSFDFVHGTALYCVYLNNMSNAALEGFHRDLRASPAYLGYIPATFQTIGKTYLSTTLVNSYVRYGDLVIMGHEDDVSNDENTNMLGYAFDEFGFRVRSLQSISFDLFLSYKVERAVYAGFEVDTEMALNAVSQNLVPIKDCVVVIDEAKLGYLQSAKIGKLQKAGIGNVSREALEDLIRGKISASYLYNLAFLEAHNVMKFNVMLEIGRSGGYPTRVVAALEYKPDEKMLRVITLT